MLKKAREIKSDEIYVTNCNLPWNSQRVLQEHVYIHSGSPVTLRREREREREDKKVGEIMRDTAPTLAAEFLVAWR
jgi:hypothetical protein